MRGKTKEIVIDKFEGEFAFLSNFSRSPIEVTYGVFDHPLVADTVEHAYQASKTLNLGDMLAILACDTPGQAKRMGQKVKLRPNWEDVKVPMMMQLLRLKFANPTLREKLIATGNATLIEGNNWGDTFWGQVNGEGRNVLGMALMLIRLEVQIND
jgi:ribA/ribD-fused uncharacterized protein